MAVERSTAMTSAEIVALSRAHTFTSWSIQGAIDPIAIDRAEGVYLYTPEGERILDFNSQLMSVNIGHGDQRVVRAITEHGDPAAVRPSGVHDGAPRRLPATYANFLITNRSILVPVYGDPADQQAVAAMAAVCGERQVVPVNCRVPIEEFGSLHCLTMQLPEGVLAHA